MRKIFGIMAIAAVAAAASWNFIQSQVPELSDLALVNVQALANGESGDGSLAWSNDIDCKGLGTGSYRVCQRNGPGNSCSEGGATTCDCGRNC